MNQADGVSVSAAGGQQQTPTPDAPKTSDETIPAAATAVVADSITISHREVSQQGKVDATGKDLTAFAAATSEFEGHTSAAAPSDDAKVDGSGGVGDRQLDATPRRPMTPGGNLRANFLAAVGNTISLTVRTNRQYFLTAPDYTRTSIQIVRSHLQQSIGFHLELPVP